jgi:hypothetical protein
MKRSINYKAITLVLGILVALLVAFTLWIRTPKESAAADTTLNTPTFTFPSAIKALIGTTIDAAVEKN